MDSSSSHAASKLTVSGGPIRSLAIVVDPALTGRIDLELKADDAAEVAAVATRRKGSRLIVDVPSRNGRASSRRGILAWILRRPVVASGDVVGGETGGGQAFRPTLDITVRVPAGCASRLDLSGGTEATVGDLNADLRLAMSGSVQATVGTVHALRVEGSGNTRADIVGTYGDLTVELSGSSHVDVALARAGSLSLRSAGSCVLNVHGGEFREANASLSGASVAKVDALVTGDLSFEGAGAFEAEFARVLGQTETNQSGDGTMRVGRLK